MMNEFWNQKRVFVLSLLLLSISCIESSYASEEVVSTRVKRKAPDGGFDKMGGDEKRVRTSFSPDTLSEDPASSPSRVEVLGGEDVDGEDIASIVASFIEEEIETASSHKSLEADIKRLTTELAALPLSPWSGEAYNIDVAFQRTKLLFERGYFSFALQNYTHAACDMEDVLLLSKEAHEKGGRTFMDDAVLENVLRIKAISDVMVMNTRVQSYELHSSHGLQVIKMPRRDEVEVGVHNLNFVLEHYRHPPPLRIPLLNALAYGYKLLQRHDEVHEVLRAIALQYDGLLSVETNPEKAAELERQKATALEITYVLHAPQVDLGVLVEGLGDMQEFRDLLEIR